MKSKKLCIVLGLVTALTFSLLPDSAKAATEKQTEMFTYQECEGGVRITDFDSSDTKLVIPDRINGKKVVEIALNYKQDGKVTDLTIGRYVRSDFDDMSLWLLYKLRAFHVSGQNRKYSEKDGVLYSKDGKSLVAYPQAATAKTFRVPAKVKSIENGAFQDTTNLKNLYINKNLTHFGGIHYCSIERVVFPAKSKVTEILPESFCQMKALKEVVLPKHLEKICDNAFEYCYNLKKLEIPKEINEIEAGAFTNCKKLHLVRPSYLKKQPNGSYYAMIRLKGKNKEVRKELIRDVKPASASVTLSAKNTKKIRVKVKYRTKWYNTDTPIFTYTASNKNITVNAKGKIRAKKKGVAVVTGTLIADGIFKFKVKVRVK